VSGLAVTPISGISLETLSGRHVRLLNTLAFPTGLAPILSGPNDGIRDTSKISLSILNSSGSAAANLYCTYLGGVKQLTTAEKVMLGVPLTSEDRRLVAKYHIGEQGFRPFALERSLQTAWYSRIVSQDAYAYVLNASPSLSTFENLSPGPDEIVVLTSLAIGNCPAGNLVNLVINRDSDLSYVSILGDTLSLDQPFSTWIPARSNLAFQLTASTSTTGVAIRFTALRIKLSLVLRVLFGELTPTDMSEIGDRELYDQVVAGTVV